jgi:hypothetical protein
MSFTSVLKEFRSEIEKSRDSLSNMSRTNLNRLFTHTNQMASSISSKYGFLLQLHFPDPKKITDLDSYGTENISIVVDPKRKVFPIPRDSIKEKAMQFLGDVRTTDAYMYEGKEGAKVFLSNGRIDILPGSLHLWCSIDDRIGSFVDWLLVYCYGIRSA